MTFLNPNIQKEVFKKKPIKAPILFEQLSKGDITALSQAITLVESKLATDQQIAQELIALALSKSGKALRIGISGVPGVGKSTFIEAFGKFLTQHHNKKVAVLAIDPSSQKTGGSILGDKTRMEQLSQNPHAFIRPSPSAGNLGGVAEKTRQSMVLCEAAGFDIIIIETVGVGQSETVVKSMVDAFLLLLLPGAGDELQGIKRGIMEMADVIAINKADGDFEKKAKIAASEVRRALHLFPELYSGWTVPVVPCSALHQKGVDEVWQKLQAFETHLHSQGLFEHNRRLQMQEWFQQLLRTELLEFLLKEPELSKKMAALETDISNNLIDPSAAVQQIIKAIKAGTASN